MKPKTDLAEIRRTIAILLEPGLTTELRALDARVRGRSYPVTLSGYFNDFDKLAKAIAAIECAKGVYITLNPINPALLARSVNKVKTAEKGASTPDTEVLRRTRLPLDFDPVRPAETSASDEEHELAIQRAREVRQYLRSLGWPEPLLGDSGNGGHLVFAIDLPADDGGLVARCIKAIAAKFDDDKVTIDLKVFNPARIWKCYGTTAAKGDEEAASIGRPHRMARILESPDRLDPVPRELLEALAATVEPEPEPKRSKSSSTNGRFRIDEWVARCCPEAKGPDPWNGGRLWVFDKCPWRPEHTNQSAFVGELANGKLTAGCHHNSCAGENWHTLRELREPGWHNRRDGAAHNATSTRKSVTPPEPFQPFPIHALPEPASGFVANVAKSIGCDHSFVALPLLAGLAAAIGATRRIKLKNGWCEPAVIWTAIVGDSGTLKSPAVDAPLRTLRKKQSKAIKDHKKAMETYSADHASWQEEMKEWKSNGRKENKPAPVAPEKPKLIHFWVSDITVEALAVRLVDSPRGVLVVRDELAGWLNSFNQYKKGQGSDAQNWLEVHRAGSIKVDRKSGDHTSIYVPHAAVSITGGIQPETLRRALPRERHEDGMAARLLFAMPPRKRKQWTEVEFDEGIEGFLAFVFDRLLSLAPNVDRETGEPYPVDIPLSKDAKKVWVEFYQAHAAEQEELTGNLSAAWSKLEGYAARFALVIHFTRWAFEDAGLANSEVIDADSMRAGITLARWFCSEARRVYAMLAAEPDECRAWELLDWIRRKGGRVLLRDVVRKGPREFRDTQVAEQALNELVSLKLGHWEDKPTGDEGGRPTCEFVLDEPPGDGSASDKTSKNGPNSGVSSPSPVSPDSENEEFDV